jgi:flagella basal body P-ring formation protein FlgA
MLIFAILITLLLAPTPSMAEEWQSLQEIRTAVETFVKSELATQPGERTVSVSRIDDRLKLARCAKLETHLPPGNRLWGNLSIGVRCHAPSTWAIHVPVQVRVSNDVLVTTRPLAAGQAVQTEDVQLQRRDITLFAGSALTSFAQVVGKNVVAPVAAGVPLRAEMLRVAKIIRQGQSVQVVAQGRGFRITSEATAMGNANPGQVVAVKTRSGQVVKGIATAEGVVEVSF